ncbi:DUF2752 domain-containing protein [Flavicella marina]|uniref:DUF2752 domain-containing protein n=1 Tax=Flavicella marina TaxID=1475951 RepID=UPI001264A1CE
METQLDIKSAVGLYVGQRKLYFIIGGYFFLATILFEVFKVDLFVPCVFKSFFQFDCFGCGFTRATVLLLKGRWIDAFEMNKLVFVVLPMLMYIMVKDIRIFLRNLRTN